jgi:hypothetical protein
VGEIAAAVSWSGYNWLLPRDSASTEMHTQQYFPIHSVAMEILLPHSALRLFLGMGPAP